MTSNPIEEMLELCQTLIDMIGDESNGSDIIVMQQSFSEAVEEAMKAYKKGEIEVDLRALPAVLHTFATEELPILCGGGPENLRKAKQQLNLFMVSVNELIRPRTVN